MPIHAGLNFRVLAIIGREMFLGGHIGSCHPF
jgi:hypothetical protein